MRLLGALVLAAAAAGCQALTDPPPDYGYLEPAAVIDRYLAWERSVRTLEGEARVEIDSPQREGSLRATVLVAKPHRFRMAAYPPVGGTVFDIAVERRQLRCHLPREEKLYRIDLARDRGALGEMDALARLFAEAGLASLILGAVRSGVRPDLRMLDRGRGTVTFGLFDENGRKTEELVFEEGSFFKTRHRTFGDRGRVVLDVTYGAYRHPRSSSSLWWPHRIRIASPDRDFVLLLDFHDVEINVQIPNECFAIDPPAGTDIVEPGGRDAPTPRGEER